MARLAQAGKVRSAVADDCTVYCPLDIHGLHHARGVDTAMAGGSDAEIMSQLEHATDRAAKIYRRQADRRRLADGAQDRVDKGREPASRAKRQGRRRSGVNRACKTTGSVGSAASTLGTCVPRVDATDPIRPHASEIVPRSVRSLRVLFSEPWAPWARGAR